MNKKIAKSGATLFVILFIGSIYYKTTVDDVDNAIFRCKVNFLNGYKHHKNNKHQYFRIESPKYFYERLRESGALYPETMTMLEELKDIIKQGQDADYTPIVSDKKIEIFLQNFKQKDLHTDKFHVEFNKLIPDYINICKSNKFKNTVGSIQMIIPAKEESKFYELVKKKDELINKLPLKR